jgi:hypothetical protein
MVARGEHILSFPVFTSRPTSLLASKGTFVILLYSIYPFTQHINIMGTDQEVMCSIHFQSFLIFKDLPDAKVEKQWQ